MIYIQASLLWMILAFTFASKGNEKKDKQQKKISTTKHIKLTTGNQWSNQSDVTVEAVPSTLHTGNLTSGSPFTLDSLTKAMVLSTSNTATKKNTLQEKKDKQEKTSTTKHIKLTTGNQWSHRSDVTGTVEAVPSTLHTGKLTSGSPFTLESLTKAMVLSTSNTATKKNTLQESNINYGIVLGAGTGGFFIGIILTTLIFICKRKRCQRDKSMTENKNRQTNVNYSVRRTQTAGTYSEVRIETLNEDQVGVYNHLREMESKKNENDTYDHVKPQHGHETIGSEYDKAAEQIIIEKEKRR